MDDLTRKKQENEEKERLRSQLLNANRNVDAISAKLKVAVKLIPEETLLQGLDLRDYVDMWDNAERCWDNQFQAVRKQRDALLYGLACIVNGWPYQPGSDMATFTGIVDSPGIDTLEAAVALANRTLAEVQAVAKKALEAGGKALHAPAKPFVSQWELEAQKEEPKTNGRPSQKPKKAPKGPPPAGLTSAGWTNPKGSPEDGL